MVKKKLETTYTVSRLVTSAAHAVALKPWKKKKRYGSKYKPRLRESEYRNLNKGMSLQEIGKCAKLCDKLNRALAKDLRIHQLDNCNLGML